MVWGLQRLGPPMNNTVSQMNKGVKTTVIILFSIAIVIYFGFMMIMRNAAGV